jgi:hypothetical protein
MEADCSRGQSSPCAAAPRGRKKVYRPEKNMEKTEEVIHMKACITDYVVYLEFSTKVILIT